MLRTSHDGYADRFGIVHQRSLRLSIDGERLDGEDLFMAAHGETLPTKAPDHFAVRFHLHPSVKANRLTDGHGVMLMLPNREVLDVRRLRGQGRPRGERVSRRQSMARAASTQIVIYDHARKVSRVVWTFMYVDPSENPRRPAREEPELPL